MLNVYFGLSNYDDFSLSDWQPVPLKGFVIGDYFCNKRMFKNGDFGLIDSISFAKEHHKEVIYQTPMYLTDRVFNKETEKIAYLYDILKVDMMLVQDIGLLLWIKKHYPKIKLIWSRLGKSRNSIMNHGFIEFLQSIGINAIEVEDPEKARAISFYNMEIFDVYGGIKYNTVSRDCYNMYLLNRFDGTCDRECNQNNMELRYNRFCISVDGHMLGYKLRYDESLEFYQTIQDCASSVIIYATDKNTAIKKYNNLINNITPEEL